MELRLEALDFEDETRWRWRLVEAGGAFVADHAVALDVTEPEYGGFVDPYRFVRWHVDSDDLGATEHAVAERLGGWIGRHVWGEVGEAIVARSALAPTVVRMVIPPEAQVLATRPLTLGVVADRPLARHDVSFVFAADTLASPPTPIEDRVRMLALFSVPTDQTALNVRRERHELRRLVRRVAITAGAAIELRVLQYGVTRQLLAEVLADGQGWDVIHFSGHGLPEGLVLERSDGTGDIVPSDQFVELLWPARERLKLVTLSSCESAAAAVAATLEQLGLPRPPGPPTGTVDDGRLPSIAQQLADRLACAAVAMRYPVDDEYAIALCGRLYEAMLRHAQPLPRALQTAIQGVHQATATRPPSALASATPMLLGASAAQLTLTPPPGEPTGFDVSTPGLAYFDAEPERFVGRVGPLARASAALAPDGRHRAVLFHGMAGAGKTACALELAYRHQRGRFDAMVWYRAPVEGQEIAGALAGFANELERQLDGLEIAFAVDDHERLARFLPRWKQLLADHGILIVLDNVESLLTADGAWRDERWRLFVEATVGHDGLSRLVLTSRQLVAPLAADERVLVEPIGSLSPGESVLLARQLPELGKLLRANEEGGDAEAGDLVRRVLVTVQGNPELLRLADARAADRGALRERLAEAARAWGSRAGALPAFFAGTAPDPQAQELLPVLEAWTIGTLARLPRPADLAFLAICAVEPPDRFQNVLTAAWPLLARELDPGGDPGAEPSAWDDAIAPAVALGLVEREDGPSPEVVRFRVHPAVEAAGLGAAPPELQPAVDKVMAGIWSVTYQHAREEERNVRAGGIVVRAGLSAAPYLLRSGEAAKAQALLERVMSRDESPRTMAAILPLMERVAQAQRGTPFELAARAALFTVRAYRSPLEALPALGEVLADADAQQDYRLAGSIAGTMVNLLWASGQLEAALELLETEAEYTRKAGLGAWTQISDRAKRLQILHALGRHDTVLREALGLLQQIEEMPEVDEDTVVEPWNVREVIADTARQAASGLEEYEMALALGAIVARSKLARGAGALERAASRYNDAPALIHLERYDEAEQLLRGCRVVFEAEHARPELARLFFVWAHLEHERGHNEEALDFTLRGLRVCYVEQQPVDAISGHNNLARFLEVRGRDPALVLAHVAAATIIAYQTRDQHLEVCLYALDETVRALGPLPASFDELCELLRASADLDLDRLVAHLSTTGRSGEEVLRFLADEDRRATFMRELKFGRLLANWQRRIDIVVAAAAGEAEAREEWERVLASLAEHDDWRALAAVLARVVAGERDEAALRDGLDDYDTEILRAVFAQLPEAAPPSGTATAR